MAGGRLARQRARCIRAPAPSGRGLACYFRLRGYPYGAASGVTRNHYRARGVAKLLRSAAEAMMVQPNVAAVRPVRRYEGLALIFLAGVVSGGLAVAMWSGERSDSVKPAAVASSTAQQQLPAAPGRATDHQARNVSTPDDQSRRLLLFLMMNGAGSLGPYGKIGR
jgi:hypothetical protein